MQAIRIIAPALAICLSISTAQPLPALAPQADEQWPTLEDLRRLRDIGEVAVSPDGRWAAYVLTPVFGHGPASGNAILKLLDLHTGKVLTPELPESPGNLKWSPGGRVLAFQMEAEGRTGLWQYDPGARQSRVQPLLTPRHATDEILDYSWSPGGDSMAFLGSASPQPSSVQTRERERHVLFSDTPGNLTGPTFPLYQRDSLGAYVAVVRLGRRGERIVRRDVVSWKGSPEIDWLHSGEMSVIGIPLNATLDQLFFARTVTIIHLQSGAVTPLALAERDAPRNPAWAPSGGRLAYLKLGRPTMDLTRPLIAYTVRAVDRTKGVSRIALSEEADGLWDLPPLWSADERTLYIGRYVRGTARLFAIDMATGSWKALTEDTLSVAYYSLAHDGKHLVVAMENSNQPRELYRLDPVSGAATRLTYEGDALLRRPLGQVDAVAWPSSDGRFTIHGYLVKPASYDRRRRYPLIVVVHGGPGAFYTNSFMGVRFNAIYLPPQLLAAAGYLVLLPNPRGDSSYGPAFQTALNGDLAAGPFRDIDSGVAALVARGLADSTCLGIYGASYGGYLTAFTVTQTHRYAAAVIDDGPINLSSLFGQEYAQGTMLLRYRLGGNPWTSRFAYTAQSPITFVDRVRTPVLMRYGGRSASAPDAIRMSLLAQGLEFYAGLTENKVPVEFVLHPDQGHAIADWQLYRDWVGRSLAWFRRWMPRSDMAR